MKSQPAGLGKRREEGESRDSIAPSHPAAFRENSLGGFGDLSLGTGPTAPRETGAGAVLKARVAAPFTVFFVCVILEFLNRSLGLSIPSI